MFARFKIHDTQVSKKHKNLKSYTTGYVFNIDQNVHVIQHAAGTNERQIEALPLDHSMSFNLFFF